MWRLTLKTLLARKLRLISTSFAVMLGVAFVSGALILTNTMNRSFDDLFADVYDETSALVRGQELPEDFTGEARFQPVPEAVVPMVLDTPGVDAAAGAIQGYAQIIDKSGKPVGDPQTGAPTFGGNWIGADGNPFQLSEGEAPDNPNEVVIDRGSAKKTGYVVGDKVGVTTVGGTRTFTLSGIATFGTADSPLGASYAFFTTPVAQELVGQPGTFTEIFVVADEGVSQAEVRDRLDARLGDELTVLTSSEVTNEMQATFREGLRFFTIFLLVFAGIALFVGSFIINNTFSILVAQRSREMALLRAIGARRAQVLQGVLLEAFVVGLIASLVGLAAGLAVTRLLQAALGALGIDVPGGELVVTADTALVALAAGLGVTMVSAILPARKASKVPPVAALREVAFEKTEASRGRVIVGLVMLIAGLALVAVGLFADVEKAYIYVGAGAALTFIAVYVLGPVFARPLSRLIGAPLPKLRGVPGQLARENAMRNPRRTSSTAAALMIGVTLVALINVFAASAKASLGEVIDKNFRGDFVVNTSGPSGVSPQLATDLSALPEIGDVAAIRVAAMTISGESTAAGAVDPVAYQSILQTDVSAGRLENIADDGIALSRATADARNLKVGDTLDVVFPDGQPDTLRIEAIFDTDTLGTPFMIGLNTYDRHVARAADASVLMSAADGVTGEEARAAVDRVVAAYPTVDVLDRTEFKEEIATQIGLFLNVIYVMLALAVVIALLGIANTLALSVFERTRELGLLRAVGMTRRQLRSTIRWESVIMALLGTFLGIVIGVVFGIALVTSLKDEGINVLEVPVGALVVVALIATVAGILAAVIPARRAARLNVLDAIATS